MRSALDLSASIEALSKAVGSYKEPPYPHFPLVYPVGYRWVGNGQPPSAVVGFDDLDGYLMTTALWADARGTQAGLFPLGNGDGRLNGIPFPGRWKRQDPSLTSVGTLPAGQLALTAPQLPAGFAEQGLNLAGYPPTPSNLVFFDDMLRMMFVIKAHEYMSTRESPQVVQQFVANHKDCTAQKVLDDLAAWHSGVVPYVQELPYRARAIALDSASDSENSMWKDLER